MGRWTAIVLIGTLCTVPGTAGAEEDAMPEGSKKATFAAGCFWGVEKFFRKMPGVLDTVVGYTGGRTADPTYEQVCSGRTGHAEAIEITYDPSKVSYEALLTTFFEWHDPTTPDRQGPDVGSQYRSAVFFHDAAQERAARRAVAELERARVYPDRIVTEIAPAGPFYAAEAYHQRYLEKNPFGYCSHKRRTDKVGPLLRAEV